MEKDCAFTNLEDKYTFKFKEKKRSIYSGHEIKHAADGVFPLSAFKPSSSDSADRWRSIIRVT
jgi:hypothetical protein